MLALAALTAHRFVLAVRGTDSIVNLSPAPFAGELRLRKGSHAQTSMRLIASEPRGDPAPVAKLLENADLLRASGFHPKHEAHADIDSPPVARGCFVEWSSRQSWKVHQMPMENLVRLLNHLKSSTLSYQCLVQLNH